MITKILNGIYLLKKKENILKNNVDIYTKIFSSRPCLSIILIDNKFSTNLYVRNKFLLCKKININIFLFKLSKTIKENTLKLLITLMNNDTTINGILIQKPVPKKLNKINLFNYIIYKKDVDLINPVNFLRYVAGCSSIVSPCISQSIFFLFNILNFKFNKAKVGIFGFSDLIGKPLCYSFLSNNFKINIIDINDKNPIILSKSCDIIIVAIGFPLFLSKKFVSYGSIVVDIGINKLNDGTIAGDSDFKNLVGHVSWITPVPGGIGPVNVFYLLSNLTTLYLYQKYNLI